MIFQLDSKDKRELDQHLRLLIREELQTVLEDFWEREKLLQINYTIKQVADMEGVTRQTINNWIKSGRLRSIKKGGRTFIRAEDYAFFKESCGQRRNHINQNT